MTPQAKYEFKFSPLTPIAVGYAIGNIAFGESYMVLICAAIIAFDFRVRRKQ